MIQGRSADQRLRTKDDSSAMEAGGTRTFGDMGRQDFGLKMGVADGALHGWRWWPVRSDPLEVELMGRLRMIRGQRVAGLTDVRMLMKSVGPGGKVAVDTTKNDNMQNRLHHRQFLAGTVGSAPRFDGTEFRPIQIRANRVSRVGRLDLSEPELAHQISSPAARGEWITPRSFVLA